MTLERFHAAAAAIADVVHGKSAGTRWFLHCDADADGIASAAIVATALRRLGHRFQVRASREKDDTVYEALRGVEADGIIVLDKGSAQVGILAAIAEDTGRTIIVIDHHNLPDGAVPDGVHLLNPRLVDLDGSRDASSATSSVAFAIALDPHNHDLAPIGLVGAIGDWQHMGGWDGWNKELVDDGLHHGHLERRPQARFIGMDLADALARFEPAIPGLHGDQTAARDFLRGIGLPADGDNESLDNEQETTLLSALTLHGAAHGMSSSDMDRFVHMDTVATRNDTGLRRMFRIVDACGREGKITTGLSYLMGDENAGKQAADLFAAYRDTIAKELERLRADGTEHHGAFQRFAIERPEYTGMVGGIGMTHMVKDKSRPMVVTATRPDGQVQVSTRGLDELVALGLDLGTACQTAAASVEGSGGGHPVAAGAVVAADQLDAFMDALDAALLGQKFLEVAAT